MCSRFLSLHELSSTQCTAKIDDIYLRLRVPKRFFYCASARCCGRVVSGRESANLLVKTINWQIIKHLSIFIRYGLEVSVAVSV